MLASKSSTPAKALRTSPVAVLSAEQPENTIALAAMAATDNRDKCIPLPVPLVAKTARYPSSPEMGDRCTALTATPLQGDRQLSSEPERWQSTAARNHDEDDRQVGMVPDSS